MEPDEYGDWGARHDAWEQKVWSQGAADLEWAREYICEHLEKKPEIKVGCQVYVGHGFKTPEVIKRVGDVCTILYESGLEFEYHVNKLSLVKEDQENEREKEMQLYEFVVNGHTKFGTKLAVNSAGDWVMEKKGAGNVFPINPTKAEEVLPNTIGVKFMNTSRVYNYFAPKGVYKVGDVFIMDREEGGPTMVIVTEADTKSKKATKDFTFLTQIETKSLDTSVKS